MSSLSLFATCLVDSVYPAIGEAVVTVLERHGHTVRLPTGQTCCGMPFYNSGYHAEAARIARHTLAAMDGPDDEPVIVPSGSCAWMMRKIYPELVPTLGAAFARRVFEFSEFVVERCGPLPHGLLTPPCKATYHPSCHLLRGLRLSRPPEVLLESVDGLELVALPDADECCGFGGSFAVREPAVSASMMEDKLASVASTGAGTLVVTDAGCLIHLDGGVRRAGAPLVIRHLAEVLAEARPEAPPAASAAAKDPA